MRGPAARGRPKPFQDRAAAGRELAASLPGFRNRENAIVLALPPGGIPVAIEVARALGLPLDVLLTRPLSVPGHEQQHFGSVAAQHGGFVEGAVIRAAGLSQTQVAAIIDATRGELKKVARLYRGRRAPLRVGGKTVVLVGDGTLPGPSLFAALHALRRMEPTQIVVALPVAPEPLYALLAPQADLLVALRRPSGFYTLSRFFSDLPHVSDTAAAELLRAEVASRRTATRAVPSPDRAP